MNYILWEKRTFRAGYASLFPHHHVIINGLSDEVLYTVYSPSYSMVADTIEILVLIEKLESVPASSVQ